MNSSRSIADFRSDTVTRPSPAMRAAMAEAAVGDDVWGDDPSVHELEERVADLAGKEAGLLFPSGTQSNLAALMTHCGRGDEYLVGQEAHTYKFEGGGAAVLGSIQPQPVEHAPDGSLPIEKLKAAVKPLDPHFARTRLLALENTIGGRVLPRAYIDAARDFARSAGLAFHLDGARAWNAAIADGRSVGSVCEPFDTVSLCFSKGLGAPIGSCLVGPRDFIEEARRWRKVLGGGMRQAGIVAKACLYALDHHYEGLAQDHENAAHLAEGLRGISGVDLVYTATNMVVIEVSEPVMRHLPRAAKEAGILLASGRRLRMVTHRDIPADGIERAVEAFRRAARTTEEDAPAEPLAVAGPYAGR